MEKRLLRLWAGVALFAIINLIIFDVIILTAPDYLQVQYSPDDAYYYLSLARNFASLHIWTFDSGVSLTTGFHPLLAYILVFLYKAFQPDTDGFVRIDLVFSSLLTISSALVVYRKAWKCQQPAMFAALAILIGARNILINSISGMEWALIVFIIVIFCVTMAEKHATRTGKIILFILGLVGSLARLDFGLLTFSFLLSSFILWFKEKDSEYLKASTAALAGAVSGVLLVFLHNYLMTGQAVQSSVLMKSLWMQGKLHGGVLIVGSMGLLLLLLIPLFSGKSSQMSAANRTQQLFAPAGLFAWIGYMIFYLKNADIHEWYSANILFSIFIFLCVLWNSIEQGQFKKFTLLPHAVFVIVFVFSFANTLIKAYPINDQNSQWPQQRTLLEAGKYLYTYPLNDGRVGAWNAGIMNYYQGGSLVNLDGLVNNDIYPYAVTNTSFEYVQKVNIRYIVDYDVMFTEGTIGRSGYNDPQVLNILSPVMTFNTKPYSMWGNLTLYKIGTIK